MRNSISGRLFMETKKILVLGNSGSGKKTALKHLCHSILENDSAICGKITIYNKKLVMFSPTGAEQFKRSKDILSSKIDGAIVFIDNTLGITTTCKEMMEFVEEKNIPYVIFTNKQDLNNKTLNIHHSKVPIFPTEAISGKGILHGLNTLLEIMDPEYEKRKIEVINC